MKHARHYREEQDSIRAIKKKEINYFYLISEDKMCFKNKREDRHKIR